MSNHWKTRLRMTSSSRESYTYAVRQNRWDPWIFIPSPLENSSRTQRSAGKAAGFLWDCEFPGMSHWFSQHQASTSNKTYLYIYTIYIDMLHMYVWLYMLYSICYILPMSHHVIPDCIPMSYPWHEAARRGAARLAARWPQKRRCNVHCCAVIQIPKRRCGDVAIFLGIFTLKSWATAGRSREIGETSPCPRLGQSALGGSRAQLDFPSGFHHQSSTMLSISMVPREGPWFSHSYNYGIIWVMWKIYID